MIGSYVINLFSKATRLGVSYTEHLFLTLRVVTGKLSNRSLKTKGINYSTGLKLKNKDNQESEQNSPSSSVLSRKVAWVQSPKLGGRPASENSSNAAKEGLGRLGIRLT